MEGWKKVDLFKDEEEGFAIEDDEILEDDTFKRSLVGKLWTTNPFNARIFKQVIVQAWRLKNPVEVQELNKNLFLFKFSTKRDAEGVLKNDPWSFDRNLVLLERISAEEQPSNLEMFSGDFWARVYDLPLKLRTDVVAAKLGGTIGKFVEVDSKDRNRMGKFLRIKTTVDLRKPLKRGTVITYQGKNLRVYFKYERLPTFCYACGKIGHQIKDCETLDGNEDTDFDEIDEKDCPFGPWLRASPLPKFSGELKKEQTSGSCSRNLFAEESNSKDTGKETALKEVEDNQSTGRVQAVADPNGDIYKKVTGEKDQSEVESVAESLGNVEISKPTLDGIDKESNTKKNVKTKNSSKQTRKWVRNKSTRKSPSKDLLIAELGKRQLVEVTISEEVPMDVCRVEKKLKNKGEKINLQKPEGVLDDQHHPTQ
ncbi:Ta11 non-LTR retrotransposon [Trifolium repens]|nr:Ta11 non-LTR retrotransposon [Trifolium repens]